MNHGFTSSDTKYETFPKYLLHVRRIVCTPRKIIWMNVEFPHQMVYCWGFPDKTMLFPCNPSLLIKVGVYLQLVSGTPCLSRCFPLASELPTSNLCQALYASRGTFLWLQNSIEHLCANKNDNSQRHRVPDTSWKHSPTLKLGCLSPECSG